VQSPIITFTFNKQTLFPLATSRIRSKESTVSKNYLPDFPRKTAMRLRTPEYGCGCRSEKRVPCRCFFADDEKVANQISMISQEVPFHPTPAEIPVSRSEGLGGSSGFPENRAQGQ